MPFDAQRVVFGHDRFHLNDEEACLALSPDGKGAELPHQRAR